MDKELIKKTQMLIDLEIGDRGRLEYIKSSLQEDKALYDSDQQYVDKLISRHLLDEIDESKKEVYDNHHDKEKQDALKEKEVVNDVSNNNYDSSTPPPPSITTEDRAIQSKKGEKNKDPRKDVKVSEDINSQNHKVSLVWQIILSFIPIIDLWVFYRIKKLRWYLLIFYVGVGIPFIIPLAIFFASFTPIEEITDFVEEPNVSLTYSIIGTAALILHVYLVVKWSKDWNAKVSGQIPENPLSKRIITIVAIVVVIVVGLEFGSGIIEENPHVLFGYPIDGKVSASITRGTLENPESRHTVLTNTGEVPLYFDDTSVTKSIWGIRDANTGHEFTVCTLYPQISLLPPGQSWESAPYTCEKTGPHSFRGLSLPPGQYEMYVKCSNDECENIKPFVWNVTGE